MMANAKKSAGEAEQEQPPVVLTERESQVVELLVDGCSHKRIAAQLGLAIGTVNNMVAEIAAKTPGRGAPSYRIRRWYWSIVGGSTEAISPPPPPND